jgi:hypothetical protein
VHLRPRLGDEAMLIPQFIERLKHFSIGLGLIIFGISMILVRRWMYEQRLEALKRMGYEVKPTDMDMRIVYGAQICGGILFILMGTFFAIASWIC